MYGWSFFKFLTMTTEGLFLASDGEGVEVFQPDDKMVCSNM